jgi:hypothetical protein
VWARLLLGSKSYRSLDEIVRSTSVGSKTVGSEGREGLAGKKAYSRGDLKAVGESHAARERH